MLSCMLSCTQAERQPQYTRPPCTRHPRIHPSGVPLQLVSGTTQSALRILFVRVAHTPIFYFCIPCISVNHVLPNRIRPSANIESNPRSAAYTTLYPIGYESQVNPPYYTRSVIKIKTAALRPLYCLFIPQRINPFALIPKTDLRASQSVTRASMIYL